MASLILAIDPGPSESAVAAFRVFPKTITTFKKLPNAELLELLADARYDFVICERIRSYGMPAGAELFETCEWSGRFWQAAESNGAAWRWLPRKDVKLHLCGSMRAKDPNVRQAIIDRFGGKEFAIGSKKSPGPLYGCSGDCWAAVAVGLTWLDKQAVAA